MPPVELGDVMRALAVGRVSTSNQPDYQAGDWVHGAFGVQEFAVSAAAAPTRSRSLIG
jgi:NADPH-dependent curcumin reductase CurA